MDPILQRVMQSGMEYYRVGKFTQAESLFRQVVRDDPTHAGGWHLLGIIARQTGRTQDAYNHMMKSVELAPENAGWRVNAASVCLLMGKSAEAVTLLMRARELNPEAEQVDGLLSMALVESKQFAQALPYLERALAASPNDPDLYATKAAALNALEGPHAQIPPLEKAVALAPDKPRYWAMLGKALRDNGRTIEARAAYERCFAVDPNFKEARLNYAMILLVLGAFPQAWDAWDARPAVAVELPRARYTRPLWEGATANGSSVLLRAEQGFGDVIQFIRYAPLVAQRGLRVFVECHKELHRVIKRVPGVEAVCHAPDLPNCNFHQLIMSLPRVFKTTLETIPAQVPYVSVDQASMDAWAQRLGPRTGKVRVGLAWAGRPTHTNDMNRSITLDMLAPLAAAGNVEFYKLQLGPAASQTPPAGMTLIDHTAHFGDFYDTAGLISQLDLLISVDTALVHLAGAMGKPVWTLLPFVPDWRWLENRNDTPWYPTMRLFRQPGFRKWAPAIGAVSEALADFKG